MIGHDEDGTLPLFIMPFYFPRPLLLFCILYFLLRAWQQKRMGGSKVNVIQVGLDTYHVHQFCLQAWRCCLRWWWSGSCRRGLNPHSVTGNVIIVIVILPPPPSLIHLYVLLLLVVVVLLLISIICYSGGGGVLVLIVVVAVSTHQHRVGLSPHSQLPHHYMPHTPDSVDSSSTDYSSDSIFVVVGW